jgi:hypothetical protein
MQRVSPMKMQDFGSGVLDESIEHPAAGIQHYSVHPQVSRARMAAGFALYEVMLGVIIFVIGVLALGRSVENCLNASSLTAEEDRVRQLLSNRMAEIQATPGPPDAAKQTTIETGYGRVKLLQKTVPAQLTEADGTDLVGVRLVTLTAQWMRGGVPQSRNLQFYVYRAG